MEKQARLRLVPRRIHGATASTKSRAGRTCATSAARRHEKWDLTRCDGFDQFEFELEFELLDELVEVLVLVDVLPFVLLSRSRSLSVLHEPPEQLVDFDFDLLDDFETETDFVPTRMMSPSPTERFAGARVETGAACAVNAMIADTASAADTNCQRAAIAHAPFQAPAGAAGEDRI
jgi:hypothetical protein